MAAVTSCLGVVVFNWGFITTVPSWINEKAPAVSCQQCLWGSTTLSMLLFFVLGVLGAMAYGDAGPNPPQAFTAMMTDNDVTSAILQQDRLGWVGKAAVYLFDPVAVMSSIPIFSIVVKYNLQENGMPALSSSLLAVVAPWLLVIPFLCDAYYMQVHVYVDSACSTAACGL